jgi:hypothetical protein
MSYALEEDAIRDRLVALWDTTAIAWPNVKYDPAPGESYIKVTVRHGEAFQSELGPEGNERVPGVVLLETYVPFGKGTQTVRTYSDSLAAIFRRVQVDDMVFGTPTAREAATQETGWHRWIVECPFYRDETIGEENEVAIYGSRVVTQAAHGLVAGDWLKVAAGTWSKALADTSANLALPGVVVNVPTLGKFRVVTDGAANLPAHGFGAAGTKLWLSQATAGEATATEPSSGLAQQVGVTVDADHVLVRHYPAIDKG